MHKITMKMTPLCLLLFFGCVSAQVGGELELPGAKPGISVIEYSGFRVGYDSQVKLPAWVAYELTDSEVRNRVADRSGLQFQPDYDAGVPQAEDRDYRRSGWTRGHMAPAADFRWDADALQETFQFTNCCPQIEYMNNNSWAALENRVRDWAVEYGSVYVVTGPILGDIVNGYIGLNRIPVPDAFYKAVLAWDGRTYKSAAFVMHNTDLPQPYDECSMTVDNLEELLNLDLFQALPDDIESAVESVVDRHFWGI